MLYDLDTDPAESYNVVDRHAEVASQLGAGIERWEREWLTNPRGWK